MYDWIDDYVVGNIVINKLLVVPDNMDCLINRVVPHEIGHWCVAVLNGYLNDYEQNINHGITWKQMMQFFEADDCPQFYGAHSLSAEGWVPYGCECTTLNLDLQDIKDYKEHLHCINCNKDYKPLK
jgi:predicted SprT family Zn-dependent metalloprotease